MNKRGLIRFYLLAVFLIHGLCLTAQGNKGYRMFFELGRMFDNTCSREYKEDYVKGNPYDDEEFVQDFMTSHVTNTIFFTNTHGYQFSQHFFLGGGFGIDVWKMECEFLELKNGLFASSYTPDHKYTSLLTFVDVRYMVQTISRLSFYTTAKVGANWKLETYSTGMFEEDLDRSKISLYCSPGVGLSYSVDPKIGINIGLSYQYIRKDLGNYFKMRGRGFTVSIGIEFKP